jgi:hypothetical protein
LWVMSASRVAADAQFTSTLHGRIDHRGQVDDPFGAMEPKASWMTYARLERWSGLSP